MECIKIIHIGDVHYPDTSTKHIVDMQDKGISREFVEGVTPNPFQCTSKKIVNILTNERINGILLSGDLTSRGNLLGYESCVTHFLQLFKSFESDGMVVHVVPGNHDLDRNEAISGGHQKKFSKFVEIWTKNGANYLQPAEVRKSSIEVSGCKLKLYSLNTCVGCGEIRRFPSSLQDKLIEIIKQSDLNNKDDFENYCEQLDTPAASHDHIIEIADSIVAGKQASEVPIILAHHGLLPQPVTRVDVYTEMINGGFIRSLLNSIPCSVIYCHGHIHQDPVEVIRQPEFDQSNLISISAPQFCDGFNVIEIYFSTKNKPLGCIVRPYRFTKFGSIREEEKISIKLTSMASLDETCHEKVEKIYKNISAEEKRFGDMKTDFYNAGINVNEDELIEILRELSWVGVIIIENMDRPYKRWTIKRVGL